MNIYLCKRPTDFVEYDEYEGFVIRAVNNDQCIDIMLTRNLEFEGHHHHGATYLHEFEITLIASGVTGEPAILLADYKAG